MNSPGVPFSLRKLLADVFDIRPDDINSELAVGSISAWDSFGHLQAILALEAKYGVQFDPAKIPHLTTVKLIQKELESRGITF
jgi:acyl carrier protein